MAHVCTCKVCGYGLDNDPVPASASLVWKYAELAKIVLRITKAAGRPWRRVVSEGRWCIHRSYSAAMRAAKSLDRRLHKNSFQPLTNSEPLRARLEGR